MAEQKPGGRFDFEALGRAAEQRDADSIISLYADDAEYRRIDRNNPPSSPMVLRGKEEIGDYLRDVFSREMTHRIEREVLGKNRAACSWACEYPDGMRVLAAESFDLGEDGRIVRHVSVQAWDE